MLELVGRICGNVFGGVCCRVGFVSVIICWWWLNFWSLG